MEQDVESPAIDRVQKRLQMFFPDETFTEEEIRDELTTGNIFATATDFLPYLQTALLDEKLIEIQFDGHARVYFGRLADDPPPPPEPVEGEEQGELEEVEYNPGEYLGNMSHIISLPVEPGLGNMHIRYSKTVLLRFFTSSYAVELGTFYTEHTKVDDQPVLKLAYPAIGRIVRGAREYTAKVPNDLDLKVRIAKKGWKSAVIAEVSDMSANSFSFSFGKDEEELFVVDDTHHFEITLDGKVIIEIDGTVRQLAKARKQKSVENFCSIQLDLSSRALASKVESTVAMVQRAHLKEMSELSEESGYELIA